MPIRFHPTVEKEIENTAGKIRLSKADTIRKATEIGLPHLLNALGVKPSRRKAA